MASSINVKIAPLPRGAYSSSATYAKLDVVSYNGSSYMAIKAVPTGTVPTNTTYWQLLVEQPSITDGSITTDKIADGAVTEAKLDFTPVTSVNGRTGDVTGLAENDGSYENMTVGNAEQLVSSTYVTDSAPYTFRTAGGSAEIGDRAYSEIVGGSIAWNQQLANSNFTGTPYPSGLTKTYNSTTDTMTFSGTMPSAGYAYLSKYFATKANHVYLMTAHYETESSITRLWFKPKAEEATPYSMVYTGKGVYGCIQKVNTNGVTVSVGISGANGLTFSVDISKVNIFDLTQMFGSTIADYIYSIDQANHGAGFTWFRNLFNKPYYPYNAGTLIHVNASEHVTTGFNQLNTDNAINATNVVSANDNGTITFKDVSSALWGNSYIGYSDVVQGQSYYVRAELAYGRIGMSSSPTASPTSSTFPNVTVTGGGDAGSTISSVGERYATTFTANFTGRIYWWFCTDAGNTNHKVFTCSPVVNLSWDGERDGEYEPYERHDYALDSSLTLRGIAKLNSSNELYFDGDEYANDGTVTRRYGIVNLGSLTWTYQSTGSIFAPFFYATLSDAKSNTTPTSKSSNILNSRYPKTVRADGYFTDGKCCQDYTQIQIKDSNYTGTTAFKNSLDGVYLIYELATPTTESADPYTNPFIVDDWGTEAFTVTEQSSVAMPVGHNTRYTSNLKAKLEMAPDSPSMGNGKYVVQHQNGLNEYVLLENEIPSVPTGTNATYVLKATVSGSTTTLSWVQE